MGSAVLPKAVAISSISGPHGDHESNHATGTVMADAFETGFAGD